MDLLSLVGAATGVAALGLSCWALFQTGLANRRAAPLVRWLDNTLLVTNLGPARARDLSISLRHESLNRPREPQTIAALSNGYTHRLPHHSSLGEQAELYVDLEWKDDRRGLQTDTVLVSQERTPTPHGPTIPDRQVDAIATRLGEGVRNGLEKLSAQAARNRR